MTMLDSTGQIKPLVERLRQAAQEGREIIEPWQFDPHLYDEAADEIEWLRTALEAIAEGMYLPDTPPREIVSSMRATACAALGATR